MRKLAALRNRSPFIGDQPLDSISLCVYGDSTGLRYWNGNNDPMPINIAGGKTLEECVYYKGGGITVYTDNIVKVRTYEGFYDYFLTNQRQMLEIVMLPTEEVVKDKEYYDKLVNGLALQYNHQIENAPNVLRIAQVLQDVNTPAPINFGCTVFPDGAIWIEEGYSVGTADKPPCPVDVPSGKLSFITNATSETHSFVMRGINQTLKSSGGLQPLTSATGTGNNNNYIYNSSTDKKDGESLEFQFILSSSVSKFLLENKEVSSLKSTTQNLTLLNLAITDMRYREDSFKQLLTYKGNLTESVLKTELAKDIKLR